MKYEDVMTWERMIGHSWWECTDQRSHNHQLTSSMFGLSAWISRWTIIRVAGELIRHDAHVMSLLGLIFLQAYSFTHCTIKYAVNQLRFLSGKWPRTFRAHRSSPSSGTVTMILPISTLGVANASILTGLVVVPTAISIWEGLYTYSSMQNMSIFR